MTFQELQDRIGEQIKADWHQHKNGGGWVHKNASVRDGVYIGEAAIVFGGRFYGGTFEDGTFEDGWFYGGTFEEKERVWTVSPLFVVGSRHTLSNCKTGHIQIGRHLKPIDWWLENYKDIGKKEGYTEEEILEYGAYIELFKKVGK